MTQILTNFAAAVISGSATFALATQCEFLDSICIKRFCVMYVMIVIVPVLFIKGAQALIEQSLYRLHGVGDATEFEGRHDFDSADSYHCGKPSRVINDDDITSSMGDSEPRGSEDVAVPFPDYHRSSISKTMWPDPQRSVTAEVSRINSPSSETDMLFGTSSSISDGEMTVSKVLKSYVVRCASGRNRSDGDEREKAKYKFP